MTEKIYKVSVEYGPSINALEGFGCFGAGDYASGGQSNMCCKMRVRAREAFATRPQHSDFAYVQARQRR